MNFTGQVLSWDELHEVRDRLSRQGKVIVFTNGCFDLLHVGHVRYLLQARALGDVLIVGLNSDASVKALKGSKRPLVTQHDRAEVLVALACVDYVVIFDELLPNRLISVLQPDIHCKGGDYAPGHSKPMPEAEVVKGYGGRVEILPLQTGYSTTSLIEQICASEGVGG